MDCKAAKTAWNNNTFGPGTANKCSMQWWFKFCKGDVSLKDERHSGWSSEFDNNQLRVIINADLTITWEVVEKLNIYHHSTIIWHLKQIEKVKNSISGCLMNWPQIFFLKSHFEVSSLILHNNFEPFLNQIVMCDKKSGFYMTTGNDLMVWLRRNLKVFPKAKLAPKRKKKKKSWSLFGGLLSDPPQLSESQWNHHSEKYAQWIKEVYQKLQHPQPVLVNRMVPVFLHNNAQLHITQATLQKLNKLRLWSFASSATSTWPLTNWLPLQGFQQLFAGCKKCFPRVCWIVKHGFLGYRNNQTYFSLAKTCWL